MFTTSNICRLMFIIAALCTLHIWVAYRSGETATREAMDRLRLVWPDIQVLQREDKALLDDAAYQCRLHQEYPLPGAIRDCLRSGAMAIDGMHSGGDALKRLDMLLASSARGT